MNIDELLQSLPSREDIASAVGLQSRSNAADLLPALGIFGTGMLFGVGLALLFAPKSGSELRQDLSEKVHEYGSQAREMVEASGIGEHVGAGQQGQGKQGIPGQSGGPGQHSSHIGGSSGGRNV